MMGWQWHQLDHMQIICTSLQTDNHASVLPSLSLGIVLKKLNLIQQKQATQNKVV